MHSLDDLLEDYVDRRYLYLFAGILMLAIMIGYLVCDLEHNIDDIRREFRAYVSRMKIELKTMHVIETISEPTLVKENERHTESEPIAATESSRTSA